MKLTVKKLNLQIINSYMDKNISKKSLAEDIYVQMSLVNNNTGFYMTKFSNYSNSLKVKKNSSLKILHV